MNSKKNIVFDNEYNNSDDDYNYENYYYNEKKASKILYGKMDYDDYDFEFYNNIEYCTYTFKDGFFKDAGIQLIKRMFDLNENLRIDHIIKIIDFIKKEYIKDDEFKKQLINRFKSIIKLRIAFLSLN